MVNKPDFFFRFGALLGALSCSASVMAEDLCPSRPIRLAHYEMGSLYSNGVGIDEDIAKEMARRSHCQFEYSVRPRAICLVCSLYSG